MKKVKGLLLILFVVLITGCGCDKDKEKNSEVLEENVNTKISDMTVEGLDIIDFIVLFENNISSVYYEVENNTENAITFNTIECSMYDKNGNILYSFNKNLGTLEKMESIEISIKVDIDLTKVTNVEYVLK